MSQIGFKFDRYQLLGLSLIGFGVILAPYSYIVLLSVALTSLGIGSVILGATLLMVPGNPVPAHQIMAMMEGSLVNLEAVFEEFDVSGRAIYVPGEERVNVFVPLKDVPVHNTGLSNTSVRVLSEVGGVRGVFVFPPGSDVVRLSLLPDVASLEDALTHVLVDFVEAVDSVKVVRKNKEITVEIVKPKIILNYPRAAMCLGSYEVSLAGCVLSQILHSVVQYLGETEDNGKKLAFFEVMNIG